MRMRILPTLTTLDLKNCAPRFLHKSRRRSDDFYVYRDLKIAIQHAYCQDMKPLRRIGIR